MCHADNVIDIHRPVEFSIDGRSFQTTSRRQSAADLLLLAGRDPSRYRLGELRQHRLRPVRYDNSDIVGLHRGTRLVSLAEQTDPAVRR
jgi:hypothetical protein